ncbi:hypothetical protein SLS64_010605 [Diaporthe eres]|uniref:Uncharacterized protein n=1 Tax=Diaporthe eres TaxID=83184 RepID=A0ABR1P6G5_DIAER
MVRFTYSLGRTSADPATVGVHLENKLVDHHRDENLAEDYLLNINPKGFSHNKTKADALRPDQVQLAESQAQSYFSELLAIYQAHGGCSLWLFGPRAGPTLLDAHTVPVIARLLDERVKRHDLVPGKLQEYAIRVMRLPEWNSVMHGRPTVWNASLGPVRDLDPLW